jgi:hypothetical protein
VTQYAESNPDAWIHSNDPMPTDSGALVEQIHRLARARRLAAIKHHYWCTCGACRVRRLEAARQVSADRAAS